MTIHETTTSLSPAEIIERACEFFAHSRSGAVGFPEVIGDRHLRLRLDMGEVVFGILAEGELNRVRASASRGGALLSRFLGTLERTTSPRSIRPNYARAA